MQRLLIILLLLLPLSVLAEADGPDAWKITGISQDSYLNLRKGPSLQFETIGLIPFGTTNLKNLGCFPEFTFKEWDRFNERERQLAINMRWCRIDYKDVSGWVFGKYLEEY